MKENNDGEDFAFDEPEDELEEFDEIGGDSNLVDAEVAVWDEDWDAAGWDDEDVNDEFIRRLQAELSNFKKEFKQSGKAAAGGQGAAAAMGSSMGGGGAKPSS